MTPPRTAREAMIADALGDTAQLLQKVEALAPVLDQSRQALAEAHSALACQLASFETQLTALTNKAKQQAVQHILARADDAARRSAEAQARAMSDAARVAFGAEVGAALQRLKHLTEQGAASAPRAWERWLTHVAAAAVGAALAWALAITLWVRG